MAILMRTFSVVLVCLLARPIDALATVLGVEPGKETSYSVTTFNCLDGSGKSVPASSINDEFCDCADGSDEPGTGACAGQDKTLFFCPNQGSMPRRIYASRVGDGVCDCCDGSDEASIASRSGKSRCSNICAEEGVRKHAEREAKIGTLKRALQRQDEIRKEGLGTRETLKAQEAAYAAELQTLESELAERKKAADVEREAKAAEEAEKKKAEEAEKAAIDGKCTWRQTGGCLATGTREASNDKPCSASVPQGTSGFCDCNNDDVYGDEDVGFGCEVGEGTRVCNDVCFKSTPAPTESKPVEESDTKADEEKPQVSEYSKWMDGAADKMGEKDATKEESGEEKQVSEYAKWMEGAGDEEDAPEEASEKPAEKPASEESTPKEKTAVQLETEAQSKVTSQKDKIEDVKEQLQNLEDDKLGYASLNAKKLSRRVSEFNYVIDFYNKASQDSVSLGNWKEWTGPRSAVFDQGTMCWGGPARKLNVNFVCGEKEEILDVFEPSRCVYEATVEHPGACDNAELESLSKGLPVVGPHDEL